MVAVIAVVIFVVFLFQAFSNGKNGPVDVSETLPADAQRIVFSESEFDFGIVKQSGGKVRHEFPFTYYGDQPMTILGTPTSCACTFAEVNTAFFSSGEKGVLTVIFNPNLHGEPEGRFYKTASILTDPKFPTLPEVKIWAQIDLDLGPEAYELQELHDDAAEKSTAPVSVTPLTATASVGFIEYEAKTLSESDFEKYADELKKAGIDAAEAKTFLVLTLDNHQKDLSGYDFMTLSELDGQKAEGWISLSGGSGGHHVSGILVFPSVEKPENLKIMGLPAGDALLVFKPVK